MSSHTTRIQFKSSEIEGIELTSLNEKKYYAFLGIPYAVPPLGNLRFKNPQILENYPKNVDATFFRDRCIQYSRLYKTKLGCEDCLHLNIFTPKLPPFDSLLPVMVCFHGGSYEGMSAKGETPYLLIEYNIIVVTFNFRLHALGFLDLGLPDCSGNMGLKDQLCALQWVKNNIKYFGGDSDNITLFGVSSGAVCAHMVAMSPLNRNLSSKLILIGCSALDTCHINPTPVEMAFELGRKFGYEGDDKQALLELLKTVPADELLKAVISLYDENLLRYRSRFFRPTIEAFKEGALLPESPLNLWKKVTNVSILNGRNEHEGTFFLTKPKFSEAILRYDALKVFISDLMLDEQNLPPNLFEEAISFYGITEKDDEENFYARVNFFSDLMLKYYYPPTDFLRPFSNSYSVYFYKFTHCGEHNIMKNLWKPYIKWNVEGSFHADEYGYLLMREKWHLPEKDMKVANTICTLWTNFIKYGTPNGKFFNSWVPSTKENPCYLQIDENLTMKYENFSLEKVNFWKYLSEKYTV